jgi:hypothetical protein
LINNNFTFGSYPQILLTTIPDTETRTNLQFGNGGVVGGVAQGVAPEVQLPHSSVVGAGVVLGIQVQNWDGSANSIFVGPQTGDVLLFPSQGGVADPQSLPPTTTGTVTPGQFHEFNYGCEVMSDGHGHWYVLLPI